MKVQENLQQFIKLLEEKNELIRIKEEVDANLVISEINDRVVKRKGPALLFEKVKNSKFPVLVNAFGSFKRLGYCFGKEDLNDAILTLQKCVELDPPASLRETFSTIKTLLPLTKAVPKKVKKGACQEVVLLDDDIDLSQIPVLTCWPEDAAPFITLPQVFTKDPITNKRNVGLYRMQVLDKKTTAMHWQVHKVGAKHYRKYKKNNISKIPVAVAIGGAPALTYSATAPLPDDMDELMLAGFLMQKRVEIVKCKTIDLYVPAMCDFILEGYVYVDDLVEEGPFGDHTGYYSLADLYPKFHITCITHRKDAVYLATIVGRPPMEDYYLAKMTERLFLPMVQKIYPEVIDMLLPVTGAFHNLCLLKIASEYSGHAHKMMSALWGTGQIMFTKYFLVLDEDFDFNDVETLIARLLYAIKNKGQYLLTEGPVDSLDHASYQADFGGKIGFDLTSKDRITTFAKPNDLPKELQEIIKDYYLHPYDGVVLHLKDGADHKQKLHQLLEKIDYHASWYVILDDHVPLQDNYELLFRICANIDPKEDMYFHENYVVLDASKKTLQDNFKRPWPNDLYFSEETYKTVDEFMQNKAEFAPYKNRVSGCHFIDENNNYTKADDL